MQYSGITRQKATCKVCFDAGLVHLCNTHKTKGNINTQAILAVNQGNWPIIKQFGQVTLCPILQNTICTNPQCFNGQNGIIRFPCFGHSISHCPCEWPQGWNKGQHLEHMRYTGYNQQQWRQIEYQQTIPPPPILKRQKACSSISSDHQSNTSSDQQSNTSSDQQSHTSSDHQNHTSLHQSNTSSDHQSNTSSDQQSNTSSDQQSHTSSDHQSQKEIQLRKEIQILREKVKKKKISWVEMCESEE